VINLRTKNTKGAWSHACAETKPLIVCG